MIVYLIRHAQGHANKNNLVSGGKNDTLTFDGRESAENLKKLIKISKLMPDRIVCSDWMRAQQTAKILFPEQFVEISEMLGETDSGSDSEVSADFFNEKYPNFYKSRKNRFKNGESHEDMYQRSINFYKKTIRECSGVVGSLALISHAGPISSILQHTLSLDFEDNFPAFVPLHATITQYQIREDLSFDKMIFFSLGGDLRQAQRALNEVKIWP
jgi:broad specificity phosphatase PhoE